MKYFYIFLFFIFACSEEEKRNSLEYKNIRILREKSGVLEIQIKGESGYILDNLNLYIGKEIPKIHYEWKTIGYGVYPFFPFPIRTVNPPVTEKYKGPFSVKTNEPFLADIEEGEYFMTLHSLSNRSFMWESEESKLIYISFGYDSDFYKGSETVNLYSKECNHKVVENFESAYLNVIACPSLKIFRGERTVLEIEIGQKINETRMMRHFLKIFPGIFMLAPFNSIFGYYYLREYKVKLKRANKETTR